MCQAALSTVDYHSTYHRPIVLEANQILAKLVRASNEVRVIARFTQGIAFPRQFLFTSEQSDWINCLKANELNQFRLGLELHFFIFILFDLIYLHWRIINQEIGGSTTLKH